MNWTLDVDAIVGAITEVDMADAGMTVIRLEGLLEAGVVRALEGLPKHERSVEVGRISRAGAKGRSGPSLAELVTRGIQLRVEEMLKLNGVERDRLLSVKRDAVFVTGVPPSRLVLPDGTRFRVKGSYTAFARLGQVELYCVPSRGIYDLKGVAEERRHLHGPFCVQFAMDILGLAEAGNLVEAADTVVQFRNDYVGLRLPLGFYRELNAGSGFCVRAGRSRFALDNVGPAFPKGDLDIVHNLRSVVVPLARALA
jgi:hypothetical protein